MNKLEKKIIEVFSICCMSSLHRNIKLERYREEKLIGVFYQRVLDLLKEVEGGLICGTANELSSVHFLLDLMLVTSLDSFSPICPSKFKIEGVKSWVWVSCFDSGRGGAWGTQIPTFCGGKELNWLSRSVSQNDNISSSPIFCQWPQKNRSEQVSLYFRLGWRYN